jgi:hypothetical protein
MNYTGLGEFFSARNQLIILMIAWLLLQGFLLTQFGIVTNYEAAKYLAQSDLLITTGTYSSNNFIFYSTQILLISLCTKLHIGFWVIVAVQMVANLLSIGLFYKLIRRFTQNSLLSFFASLLFLSMYYYHLYNVHLFTESLFFSFSIFFSYFLFNCQKPSAKFILTVILFLALLSFTRPTGILFIPPTLFFLIFRFGEKKALPIFIFTLLGGTVLFYFVLNAALRSGGELDFLLPYVQEHIICGVPTVQQPNHIEITANKNSVEAFWDLIKNNTGLFLRLAKQRFIAFWGVQRSFFAPVHNFFLAAYFYSLYALIIWSIRKMFRRFLAETIFMLSYIFLVMLTVILSCDEWHNRFIFSILPFLLMLSVRGFIKKPLPAST